MTGQFISQRDYRDWNGFGVSTPDDIIQLKKALTAGNALSGGLAGSSGVALGAAGDGSALRMESLENTLKNLTFEMDEIKLFQTIPKMPATNTSEEFNRLMSYSSGGDQAFDLGWMTEGALPEEEDSIYERVAVLIKFLGVVGRVSHVMNTVRSVAGSPVAIETTNKTMHLLQQLEHALFYGDSSLNPLSMDGLYKLISDGAPNNIIDLRGKPLTEDVMNDVLELIRANKGVATDLYSTTGVIADLAKQTLDRQRFGIAPAPGTIGAQVTTFQGQNGKLNLHDSIFIRQGDKPRPNGLGKTSKRPMQPTTASLAAGTNAASNFGSADAGTYGYQVVARNQFGAAAPVQVGSQAVTSGQAVTFNITDGGNGTTWYEIYRTAPGDAIANAKLITRIAKPSNQVTVTFTDLNNDLPGCGQAFVLMQNARSFQWAQLLPMTRIPLAPIDTSIRWAQVIYGAIKMYAPTKNVVLKNIGRLPGTVPTTPTALV